VDDLTFRQRKESKYYHPETTDIILDPKKMLEIVLDSIKIAEKGYDAVLDSIMFKFLMKDFENGIDLIDKRIVEKEIKSRLVIDANKENIDFLNSIKKYDIKYLDDIRGNFGIFDNRAYMVQIFHKENDLPFQTLWSNSKVLVDKQQMLFDRLWEIAIPLSTRRKELEYEQNPNYQKTLTKYQDIQNEIISLIEQTRRELLLFSSTQMLTRIFHNNIVVETLSKRFSKDVNIRILTDDINLEIIKIIKELNKKNTNNSIQFSYTNKLGNIDRLTIVNDGKLMLQANLINNDIQDLVASLSNEEHKIAVQEILFEKYWNETNSLAITNIGQ
jgi:hypothetical protein